MRKFKFIPPYICAAALLLAGGCAAELEDEPVITPGADESFWVSFRLTQGSTGAHGNAAPYTTRATDTDKSDTESKIRNIVGIIFETDDAGNPTKFVYRSLEENNTFDETPTNGETTVLLNMGFPANYDTGKKYRLYVYANMDM